MKKPVKITNVLIQQVNLRVKNTVITFKLFWVGMSFEFIPPINWIYRKFNKYSFNIVKVFGEEIKLLKNGINFIYRRICTRTKRIKPSSSFSLKSQVPSQTNNITPLWCLSNNFGSLFRIISKCLEHRIEGPLLSEIKTGQREVKFKLAGMSKFPNC